MNVDDSVGVLHIVVRLLRAVLYAGHSVSLLSTAAVYADASMLV